MLKLADDPRFTMGLNDSQKLDYLLFLLMAGLTHNEIPEDFEWFKSRFHLQKNTEEIKENVARIRSIFKKFKRHGGKLKFTNFKSLHNYVYKESDNDLSKIKEFYKNSEKPPNIYLVLSYIISFYINIKGYKENDIDISQRNRYGKRLKRLLVLAKGDKDLVTGCIEWVSKQGYCEYTLETCINKFPDFLKWHNRPELLKKLEGK